MYITNSLKNIFVFILDYDRPLPLVPSKRPREEMEISTASDTEEDPAESDSIVEEASGSECEPNKRRKQADEIIPRLVAILFRSMMECS